MLKEVEISSVLFKKNETDFGFIIENLDDLFEYFAKTNKETEKELKTVLENRIPVQKWDHVYGIISIGAVVAGVKGTAPVEEIVNVLNLKQKNMFNYLKSGKKIFVNRNGGYHEYKDSTHSIVAVLKEKNRDPNIHYSSNPSLINLENDPVIENETLKYFKSNNLDISYVKKLRKYSEEELIDIFNDFYSKGGIGVFVYTTGNDLIQMKSYLEALNKSLLNKIIIQFKNEINEEQKNIINKFKMIDIKLI